MLLTILFMSKKAIVFGASGLVGSNLVELLLEHPEYREVEIFTRKRSQFSHDKLKEKITPFQNIHEELKSINGDTIFFCIGTTIKKAGSKEVMTRIDQEIPNEIAQIASKNGVKTFALVSSIGANPNSRTYYTKLKGETENLIKTQFPTKHIIARPSLLLGERSEFRLGELISKGLFRALSWSFVGPLKRYKGIQARDVAKALIRFDLKCKFGTFESDVVRSNANS